jgi:hypothetical protein
MKLNLSVLLKRVFTVIALFAITGSSLGCGLQVRTLSVLGTAYSLQLMTTPASTRNPIVALKNVPSGTSVVLIQDGDATCANGLNLESFQTRSANEVHTLLIKPIAENPLNIRARLTLSDQSVVCTDRINLLFSELSNVASISAGYAT